MKTKLVAQTVYGQHIYKYIKAGHQTDLVAAVKIQMSISIACKIIINVIADHVEYSIDGLQFRIIILNAE